MNEDEYKRLNTRKASIVHVGGFRPTGDPLASHFGLSPVGLPGEGWPSVNGEPMRFICQLNLTKSPFVPDLLKDIALVTFFVAPELGRLHEESGKDWCLRAYASTKELAAISRPANAPPTGRGFECRWEAVDDQPVYDDPDIAIPAGFDNADIDLENVRRTKIGGYASNIQSEQWWGYRPGHPAVPRFCLQIDSEEKIGLIWGDTGAAEPPEPAGHERRGPIPLETWLGQAEAGSIRRAGRRANTSAVPDVSQRAGTVRAVGLLNSDQVRTEQS